MYDSNQIFRRRDSMEKYQLLEKYRYRVNSDQTEIEKEYQRRLNGYATVQTTMIPTLMTKDGFQDKKYPIFFIETRKINQLTSNVNKLSRKIMNLTHAGGLPIIAQSSFINSLLANEIYFTNQIEGVQTNKKQIGTIIGEINTVEGNQTTTKRKSRRLESTIKMYNDTLKGNLIQIREPNDVRKIYDQLLEKEISADKLPDGNYFRNSKVRIGTDTATVHLPPVNESEILNAIMQLIEFMNDDSLNEILKAIVTHFMFENTHPFYDGNGRTGRYLLSSYLSNKVDPLTGISISTAIHENVQKYYREFKSAGSVENRGDLTLFITALLEIIVSGQENVINKLTDLRDELNEKEKQMRVKVGTSVTAEEFQVLYVLLQSALFSTMDESGIKDNELIDFLNKVDHRAYSRQKVHRIIDKFEKQGTIIKIQGRPKQHKLNQEYLDN